MAGKADAALPGDHAMMVFIVAAAIIVSILILWPDGGEE